MLFNENILSLKLRYLDSTPRELVQCVAEKFAGKGAHIAEIPRQWTPGGGSQNFMISSGEGRWFLKAKHKSLLVESALESEPSFSTVPALQNEHAFLCALSASPHVPRVKGYVEQGDYLFLATEALQPFDAITAFSPMQIVTAYQTLAEFTRELYARGIVHTDIHEKNICFRGTTPVLIDFEEARYLKQGVPFGASLDVAGQNSAGNVGQFPAVAANSIKGLTCLNRLKKVFKSILQPKLQEYLAQCNFDCSSSFNLDVEQQPDQRIYQSVNMPGLTIKGQRPMHDGRLEYVRLAVEHAHAALGRRLDIVDLGANMGMVAFFCGSLPQVRSVVGLEADPRYVEAAKVLAFYSDIPRHVVFEEYITSSRPYKWKTDVLLMLSVYHHVSDKDAFLHELSQKNIACIICEFAVQERYYAQRGNLEAEIAHIKKTLGFKTVERLAMSADYQRPLVIFHNGSQSIGKTKTPGSHDGEAKKDLPLPLRATADKALAWVRAHSEKSAGVYVSNQKKVLYPEVTGYFIPTLLQWGLPDLALQYAKWLIKAQQPNGTFLGPGLSTPFAFDTGQVIRGLAAVVPHLPEAAAALEKACDWIIATADASGRLALPENLNGWRLPGDRGHVNEAIHLYVLPGLAAAAEALNRPQYSHFVQRSLSYYITHCNLTNFLAPNMLLHFYCYIQEALFDLGAGDMCRLGMRVLADIQDDKGVVPAYADVSWICSPGLIQAALVWLKLGDMAHALPALRRACSLQTASGGFPGSVGTGAEYFPDEELSWAAKFYLDALRQYELSDAPREQFDHITVDAVTVRIVAEKDMPIIRLEQTAAHRLESQARAAVQGGASPITECAVGVANTLLDWGRRSEALALAQRFAPAPADQGWAAPEDLFHLGDLIRLFRQPEVLAQLGDTPLKQLCLHVFHLQRQSAHDVAGLFYCFGELLHAGATLGETSWVDCARGWAARQRDLPEQTPSVHLVLESVGVGHLCSPANGLSLLGKVAASIGLPPAERGAAQTYAAISLALARGAWILGDDELGQSAFCRGVSALANGESAALQTDIFDARTAMGFLDALAAMQRCRFALEFPQFLDDIAADDGRLHFVHALLPQSPQARILDMGTAKGRYLRRLRVMGMTAQMTAQDVHPSFLPFMPKGVATGIGTVLRSGWADASFDAVTLCEVLEHCIDLPAAIRELGRILADGGTLIIVDKNVRRLSSWPGGIPPWEQWFDCGDLATLLQRSGFVIKEIAPDVPYAGRRDGLFFGIAAQKAV